MPHRLIVGSTLTGKSTLARKFVEESARRGVIASVYDPIGTEWPADSIVVTTEDEMFALVEQRIKDGDRQLCVWDESDTIFHAGNRQRLWVGLRGRHYGLENCFLTQRPQLIVPSIRNQCAELCAFRISRNDAVLLAGDFSDEGIVGAVELAQGEFLYSRWKDGKKVLDKYSAFD